MSAGPPHRRGHRGGRPPWWPEGEPVPPEGERRRHVSARFVRRIVTGIVLFVLVVSFLIALFVSLLLSLFSSVSGGGPLGIVLAVFLVLVVGTTFARGMRRLIAPLGDLIAAAESIEAGDYSVRVRERGPRELRALARAVNAMSARLERSETERRRLLADVTHELRTPLTVIQGNIEALIDGVRPADPAHLEGILDETRVLSRLVDDLRTISIAEAGALALHREPTDVLALARETVASFGTSAGAAGVTLAVHGDGAAEAEVDPIRVREVLANVVANALRYTPRGGNIAVTVGADEREVSVGVRDTGPGIAADVLPHVFDRFTRSAGSPGAGLGLAIAKSLVTAHGGAIAATSEPGQGTEVRFTLPRDGAS